MNTGAHLEPLDLEQCLAHLRFHTIGRIAVIVDDGPVLFPVNYRLVEAVGSTWIALRTRPGNSIDRPGTKVAFEIDDVDPVHQRGWSVLVLGTLVPIDPDLPAGGVDPAPWIEAERDAWLAIEPSSITGRELHPSEQEWAFHLRAYL